MKDMHRAFQPAVAATQRINRNQIGPLADSQFEGFPALALAGTLGPACGIRPRHAVSDLPAAPPDHCISLFLKQKLSGPIAPYNPLFGIQQPDGITHRIKRRLPVLLRRPQCFLHRFALGNILDHRLLGERAICMPDGHIDHIVPAIVLRTFYLPADRFSLENPFVDAPRTDRVKIMQRLVTRFAHRVIPRAFNQTLIHEFHTIVWRADIKQAIERLHDGTVVRFTFLERCRALGDALIKILLNLSQFHHLFLDGIAHRDKRFRQPRHLRRPLPRDVHRKVTLRHFFRRLCQLDERRRDRPCEPPRDKHRQTGNKQYDHGRLGHRPPQDGAQFSHRHAGPEHKNPALFVTRRDQHHPALSPLILKGAEVRCHGLQGTGKGGGIGVQIIKLSVEIVLPAVIGRRR